MPGKGSLQLTGKLGDVIKESASIALSWMKANAYSLGITKEEGDNLLKDRDVHLHMPEGAIGKEGPSAGELICVYVGLREQPTLTGRSICSTGVAFTTSLISLLTNRPLPTTLGKPRHSLLDSTAQRANRFLPVFPSSAMSGEISLRGMVLPVGGLKEKLLAAHRAGIRKVILPAQNRPNVEADVPETVLKALDVHYVSNVWAALDAAFGQGPWTEMAEKMKGLDLEEPEEAEVEVDRPTQDKP